MLSNRTHPWLAPPRQTHSILIREFIIANTIQEASGDVSGGKRATLEKVFAGRRQHVLPMPVTLALRESSGIVHFSGDRSSLEVILSPITFVECEYHEPGLRPESTGSTTLRLQAACGAAWGVELNFDESDSARETGATLVDAILCIVEGMHQAAIADIGSAGDFSWYPVLSPPVPANFDTTSSQFLCGGYAIEGTQRRRNHPASSAFQWPPAIQEGPQHFRFVWLELSRCDDKTTLNYYPAHDRTTRQDLLTSETFSVDDLDLEVRGHMLVMCGLPPVDGIRSWSEVPVDIYLAFRSPAEARFWHNLATNRSASETQAVPARQAEAEQLRQFRCRRREYAPTTGAAQLFTGDRFDSVHSELTNGRSTQELPMDSHGLALREHLERESREISDILARENSMSCSYGSQTTVIEDPMSSVIYFKRR